MVAARPPRPEPRGCAAGGGGFRPTSFLGLVLGFLRGALPGHHFVHQRPPGFHILLHFRGRTAQDGAGGVELDVQLAEQVLIEVRVGAVPLGVDGRQPLLVAAGQLRQELRLGSGQVVLLRHVAVEPEELLLLRVVVDHVFPGAIP